MSVAHEPVTQSGEKQQDTFASWAILELMGHRRLGGYVQEATLAGGAFLRIDVPSDNGDPESTQFYSPGSVYCLTPVSEETARLVARSSRPQPVHQWELPRPRGQSRDDIGPLGDYAGHNEDYDDRDEQDGDDDD